MLRTLIQALCALILISSFHSRLWAAELYTYAQSVRQLGMGGVFVFSPDDASSFLQNPAYSCFSSNISWTVFDANGGANGPEVYNELSNFDSSAGLEAFSDYYGTRVWMGGSAHTTLMLPCFGVSGWSSGYLSFLLTNPAFPNLEITMISDYAAQVGAGYKISDNVSVGMSLKRIVRTGGTGDFGAGTLADFDTDAILDSLQSTGVGFSADIGVAAKIPDKAFNPVFSLAWRDAGGVKFNRTRGDVDPPRLVDNLVLGMSFSEEVPLMGINGGLEFRHLNLASEQLGKKIHMGLEINLAMLDVRAGFYQGYTTYGAGFDIWLFQIDLASYTAETGAYAGQTPSSRYQLSIKTELSFDASFKLIDVESGKTRKLKRRR